MPQEKLQTMVKQRFWGVLEVYYGIVQVVNTQNVALLEPEFFGKKLYGQHTAFDI